MKYIVLICDGAADWPIEELGNKTILEATETPNMDWVASNGQMGMLRTIPNGMKPGSECANMTIMGYNPKEDLTGRGPLEALSAGVPLSETDLAFRCNLITIEEGIIKDYSAGHITTEEGRTLIYYLQKHLNDEGIELFPGIQYRHILRLDGKKYDSSQIITTPPHDQIGKPYKDFLVKTNALKWDPPKRTADCLNQLILKSFTLLKDHEINVKRKKEGKRMATTIWPWSGGRKPEIEPFNKKYGLEGSVISAVDLIFGLGIAAGLEPIHVEGATGLPDTNYEGKVEAALKELKTKDLVFLHIEAIDEMGHTGDPNKKMAALKDFDKRVVGPIIQAEKEFNNELVIAILPDHFTPIKIRTHSDDPIPFAIYNPNKALKVKSERKYSEKAGSSGELGLVEKGEEFIRIFLS